MTNYQTYILIGKLLKNAGVSRVCNIAWKEFRRRMFSDETGYVFSYDLSQQIDIPETSVAANIRSLKNNDIHELLVGNSAKISALELRARIERLLFLRAEIPSCYICATDADEPMLIVWLLTAQVNSDLCRYFGKGIQQIKEDEVLFEFIYTHRKYRGLRMHSWAQLQLFHRARQMGFRRAIAYVSESNDVSLRTTVRFGWKPCLKKTIKWRIFRKEVLFAPLNGRYNDSSCN